MQKGFISERSGSVYLRSGVGGGNCARNSSFEVINSFCTSSTGRSNSGVVGFVGHVGNQTFISPFTCPLNVFLFWLFHIFGFDNFFQF